MSSSSSKDASACHTSCGSFSFDYQWTVSNLKTLVDSGANPKKGTHSHVTDIESPVFTPSGFATRTPCCLSCRTWRLKEKYNTHICQFGTKRELCKCIRISVGLRISDPYSTSLFGEGSISLMLPSKERDGSVQMRPVKTSLYHVDKPRWINFSNKDLTVDITESELQDGSSKYTYEDSLTIFCDVTVYNVHDLKHITNDIPSVPAIDLTKALNEDRENKLYTDVSIACGRRKFKVHRIVLASHSTFFKNKLERWETGNNTIDMSDLSAAMVGVIIDYMYTGTIADIDEHTEARDLLAAAEKYQIIALKHLCERTLLKTLDESNAISLVKFAAQHNAEGLQQKALDLINTTPVKMDMIKALIGSD